MMRADRFYSRNAERYADMYGEDSMSDELLELRKEFVERVKEGRVLDAGCGPGRDTDFFERQGLDAVGTDLAPGMIGYARENRKGDFRLMDLRELDFEDNSFDGVWCNAAIFFLEKGEIEDVLESFHRLLNVGGALYVDFKQGDGRYVKEKWDEEVEEHRVSEQEAREMLEKADFSVESFNRGQSPSGSTFLDFLCVRQRSKE